jgi:hypothetical protein
MALVTQAEYARHRGVSRAAVNQWKTAGAIVMEGTKVDLEASDAHLLKYRVAVGSFVKHAGLAGRAKIALNKKASTALNSEPVTMRCGEVLRLLEKLDHSRRFEWSDEAERDRAKKAAQCVGWDAVESNLDDEGHWGGFQLRIPEYIKKHGLVEGSIAGGFGFEMCPHEVIAECREHLVPCVDPVDGSIWRAADDEVTFRLDLLPMLARPIFQAEDRNKET